MEPILYSLMQPYAKLTDAYNRIEVKDPLRAKLFIDAIVPVSKIPNDDPVLQQRGLGYLLFVLPVLLKSTAKFSKAGFDDMGKLLLEVSGAPLKEVAEVLTNLQYKEIGLWMLVEDAERVTINTIHNEWKSSIRDTFVAFDTITIGKRHIPAIARASDAFNRAKNIIDLIREEITKLHYLNDAYLFTCSIESIRNQIEILSLLVCKDQFTWEELIKTEDEEKEYIERLCQDYKQILRIPDVFESALVMLEQREHYFPNKTSDVDKITEYLTVF